MQAHSLTNTSDDRLRRVIVPLHAKIQAYP